VLNQFGGHWLLPNTLATIVILIMNMEIELLQLSNPCKVLDLFEVKILLLHRNMQLEVIKVIKPSFDFLKFLYMQ
jgi:hypothetical protein